MARSSSTTNNEQRTTDSPNYTGQRTDTTTYFSGKTEAYQRYRPGYPRAAMEFVLRGLPSGAIVADVGCGTGISSRALASAGARVIGIDPNEEMLNAARAIAQPEVQHPIDYRRGMGEATGLDDRSIDSLVCAQSFHWFDRQRALREFHRILRPGGRLALLWNSRDERDEASAQYEAIIHRAMSIAENTGRAVARFRSVPSLAPWFEAVAAERFDNPSDYALEELLGRARSSSYWPEPGPARADLEGELEALFRRHETSGRLHLCQFTTVTLARSV